MTGGIGAGKSAAVDAFVRRGAARFSADEVVHRLYAHDDDVRAAVRERWGDRVFAKIGEVDRGAIAAIVFSDEHELRWLEGLLHPLVAREWMRTVHELGEHEDAPEFVVAEVPLLFEAGLDDRYDATVLVTAPLDRRLARVGERAHGASHAGRRAARQLPEHEQAMRARFVYENTGSLADLDAFVEKVITAMRERVI